MLLLVLLVGVARAQIYDNSVDYDPYVEVAHSNEEFLRIAGGSQIEIVKRPFVVQIRILNSTRLCGGAIMSENWVLTAASCLQGALAENLIIRSGTTTLDVGGKLSKVADVITHALYNITTHDYDFSLLKLLGNFTFDDLTKPIQLPNQGQNLPIIGPLIMAGWGLTSSVANIFSTFLREANVVVVPLKICRLLYGNSVQLSDRMFCGGKILFGGKGACRGDTGGPVVFKNVLVGLMSMGSSCGDPIFPAIFSQVSAVTTWIKAICDM